MRQLKESELRSYKVEVLKRFMSEAEFKSFHERYIETRKSVQAPTQRDFDFANAYRSGSTMVKIAKDYGVRIWDVDAAVRRVSRYYFLKDR